jgi:hypothetical protein
VCSNSSRFLVDFARVRAVQVKARRCVRDGCVGDRKDIVQWRATSIEGQCFGFDMAVKSQILVEEAVWRDLRQELKLPSTGGC